MSCFATDPVAIQEVVMRDGLQIEAAFIATQDKIALIDALSGTGLREIEATSFVSAKAVPNLRDAAQVMAGITRNAAVAYGALVPNRQGAQAALAAGVDALNLVVSASETHNRANMRMSCAESFASFAQIMGLERPHIVRVNGTIATAFGCPFEGDVAPARVLAFSRVYVEMGVGSLMLADTTGMADPAQVFRLVSSIRDAFPRMPLSLHFHDTRGMGLANVLAAYQAGARRFDAALGGLGGCPFAPGATGNICTEDTVHMFDRMGIATGIDLSALIAVSQRLPALVGHETPGQVAKAGPSSALHTVPTHVAEAMRATV